MGKKTVFSLAEGQVCIHWNFTICVFLFSTKVNSAAVFFIWVACMRVFYELYSPKRSPICELIFLASVWMSRHLLWLHWEFLLHISARAICLHLIVNASKFMQDIRKINHLLCVETDMHMLRVVHSYCSCLAIACIVLAWSWSFNFLL